MADELLVEFAVLGKPEPRGSKDAFPLYKAPKHMKRPVRRKGGRVTCQACGDTDGAIIINVSDANPKSEPWMRRVAAAAQSQWRWPLPAGNCAMRLDLEFYLRRPGDHYGTGRNAHLVKDIAPAAPLTPPDEIKLARGVEDALTGVCWIDDAQVTLLRVEKFYAVPTDAGPGEGVVVRVYRRELQLAEQLPLESRVRVLQGRDRADETAQTTLV